MLGHEQLWSLVLVSLVTNYWHKLGYGMLDWVYFFLFKFIVCWFCFQCSRGVQ